MTQHTFPQPFAQPFAQSFPPPLRVPHVAARPVAHDPWRWLVGPMLHAAAVVLAGVVLAVASTLADGGPGLAGSLLQSALGAMGTPFSLSATALPDSARPAATAAVLVLAALVWVVPHAAASYCLDARRRAGRRGRATPPALSAGATARRP